ncbi:MAG TPA: M12 family metallo-peptidase, partial [Pyrinomonadaceae bacterium]
ELSFELLDGKTYRVVRSEAEGFAAFADGGLAWRGKLVGQDGWSGDVTLSVKGAAMSGLIYSPDGVYEIVPQGDFRHLLVEINQDLFPACAGALPQRPASETAEADAVKAAAPAAPTAADDGSLIDVLVVYTSNVRSALGGTTQAQAFAQQSINSTNTAYINSGINPRVRMVGTLEASYTEAGTLDAALKWVDDNSAVAAARNSLKADMVALIVENASDGCGLAYVMRSVGPGFSGSAFSATARGCAVGNLSFAHELGHNEGCEHNPENGASSGSASYPYAFGHYVDGSFRTVMSYENPCTFGCSRVAYFSNPSVSFNGHPTGITNQRDNRRVINNTALTISQFRDGGGGGGGGVGPANNNFASAQVISGNTGVASGTNVGATKEAGEPVHAGNAGGTSVWYQWQAPATGTATLTTAGSGFDTLLAVYTGSSVGALTLITGNDDVGGGDLTSRVVFNAVGGTTYRIAVDGFGGATGSVTLNWNNVPPFPAHDNFVNAQVISGNVGTVLGTNAAATKEAGEPAHGGNSGGSSVWYRWQAPSSGSVTITTAGSGFDTLLGVYTGSSVGALTLIAGNDDDLTLNSLTSRVTFNAVGGTTYRVAVDGYANATGSIALNWNLTQSCSFSTSSTGQTFASGGGTGAVIVTATAGCSWTAVSNASFITITSAPGGTGGGTLSFSVAANPNTTQRTGTITVAGRTFTVTQVAAPCTYLISPASQSFSAAAGTGSVSVTASAGCGWTAASNSGFVSVTAGSSGTGSGTVSYSVAANTGTLARAGTLTVAGA